MEAAATSSGGPAPRPAAASRPVAGWFLLAGAVSAVIVVALARAVARGYVPLADNALVEIYARDVLSRHIPLVNTLSTAGSTVALDGRVRHPGPLLFDVLALPVRIGPHGVGLAIGAALINVGAVWSIGWTAARAGGRGVAAAALSVVAVLVWAFGGDVWIDAWQPHITMLPFLALLVAAWGYGAGAAHVGPLVVVWASLVVQTHGSYVVVVPAAVAAAVVLRLLRRGQRRVVWSRAALVAALAVALWAQTLIQQLFGPGPGNLGQILRAGTRGDVTTAGAGGALRLVATVVALPPWFLHWGIDSIPAAAGQVGDLVATPIAAVVVVALASAGLVELVAARRRGDEVVVAGIGVALAALVGSLAFLHRLPTEPFGVMAHTVRPLWPLGAFVALTAIAAAVRLGDARMRIAGAMPRRVAVALCAVVALPALVATLPARTISPGGAELVALAEDAGRRLRSAAAELDDRGVVFLPIAGGEALDVLYATVAAELVARGVEFAVADPLVAAQLGHRRPRLDPDVTFRILLLPVDADAAAVDGEVLAWFEVELPESMSTDAGVRGGDAAVVATVTLYDDADDPEPLPAWY